MKKIYLVIGMGMLLTAGSFAQIVQVPRVESITLPDVLTLGENNHNGKVIKSGAKGATEVFFSEDFSNGFAGQGANGAWTIDGANGNLWFQTFPVGTPNGYNPNAPLPAAQQVAYGLFLPNYFGTTATIASPTAANGFMMMDADRFNSTKLNPNDPAGPNTTSNTITTMLVSPSIDLTAVLGQSAILTFSQKWRMCCTDYSLYLQVSLDGGGTWITGTELDLYTQPGVQPGTGGPSLESLAIIDLSTITTNASVLSDFRFRFVWEDLGNNPAAGSTPSHYYFMIDDIEISAAPQNELIVGNTYINDYFFIDEEAPDVEYVNAYEYWDQPAYLKRPFNFIAEVINNGTQTQTGVVLTVEFEDPTSGIQTFTSNPISIAAGETAYPSIDNVVPSAWENPVNGTYTARFTVTQDQLDQFPDNNIGLPRTTRINSEAQGALFQNDRNVFTNIPLIGQDVIFANRFAFTETDASNLAITHIDYVLSGSANGPTQIGEVFYLNVRSGSVFEAEGPNNVMTRYFADDECETVTVAGTLSSGATLNWISYALPSPVLIEPNIIYQGEIEVPASAEDIVFPALSNLQEPLSGILYNFESPQPAPSPQGWGQYGPFSFMIRFRTNSISSVNTISYESGIKVTQNWPNPFVDETKIQFQLDETANVTFEVHDVTGKLVHIENLGLRSAMSANVFTFPRRNLEAGVYTYSIVANGERVTRKMIVE